MTEPVVSHAEMIAAVRHEIETEERCGYDENPDTAKQLAAMRAVLATLERHERAMAVVEAARVVLSQYEPHEIVDAEADLQAALAAFDAAGAGET